MSRRRSAVPQRQRSQAVCEDRALNIQYRTSGDVLMQTRSVGEACRIEQTIGQAACLHEKSFPSDILFSV